jgi:hypothetical protein
MRNVYIFRRPRRRRALRWTATALLLGVLALIFAPSIAISTIDDSARQGASLAMQGTVTLTPPGAIADIDCTDLKTQTDAQTFFERQGPGDRHRLDRDHDGVACEQP